ncbi:MAG: hypothetical protein H3C43_01505 [Leptonema sp. (in: Bacteria)]|nr:hypothetical protein [Leptonema sp. (in: bacteria)]
MEFDRTRKAIGSGSLDEEERKRLLGTFTSSGGKVLDEKSLRRAQALAKKKSEDSSLKAQPNTQLPSERRKEERARELDRIERERNARDALLREATSFLSRFSIKFKCMLSGLSPFSSAMAKPAVLSFFSLELRTALIECNILGNELLANNTEFTNNLKKELKSQFYIELVNRARLLYDRKELGELLSLYSEGDPRPVPLESIRLPIFSLLRKLYALMPFRESYLKTVETGILLQQRYEKKPADLYAGKLKRIEASWRVLMDKTLPKLESLAQRLEMKNIDIGHPLFEEMIGFTADMRIQVQPADKIIETQTAKSETETKTEEPATEESSIEEEINPEEKQKQEVERRFFEYGLSLHRRLPVEQLRKNYDSRNEYSAAELRDKAFLSYLLLCFFDDQFAFILTTNQLKLEPINQGGIRINLKQDLIDLYQSIRSCHEHFKSYYHDLVEYRKAVSEGAQGSNYVEHSKKVSMFETRRGKSGREIRNVIKNYMTQVERSLGLLLKDLKEGGRVIMNPDDIYSAEMEADKQKLMNGHKMKEIIRDTYAFAYTLNRRLENGDLFGGVLELSDEDYNVSVGKPVNENPEKNSEENLEENQNLTENIESMSTEPDV